MAKNTLFYKDKPLVGLDIGHDSFKVMQLRPRRNHQPQVVGYGTVSFNAENIVEGVVEKPEAVAEVLKKLLSEGITGKITSKRAAIAIPAYRTYSRSIQLPLLDGKDLEEAVRLEAEQYISVPLKELYLDYTVTGQTETNCDVYLVAVPRKIVDSHVALVEAAGLEVMLVETSIAAEARLFAYSDDTNVTTALIDFGNLSGSISLFDKTTLVTGTVPVGGRVFTDAIQQKFDLTYQKANYIKTKYGLNKSKWQKDILTVIDPALSQVVTEIRRTLRYYQERYGATHQIGQIVMLGGGSNMPGLSDYLTNALRIPVRVRDPWLYIDHAKLQEPRDNERLIYASVAGLSLINPREVYRI